MLGGCEVACPPRKPKVAESDTVNFMKLQRIKWAGHVVRMEENRTTKKSSMPNQLAHEERAGQILDGLMA
ncbi:hypothetical protein TNCV_3051661 [Trichonephila clavipes]|nr:hypothetical protein TNCV_3051661 [Trichonephila clavipes]